ncbi:hypothetical protein UB32_07775 [Mesobacillus subterraneus]|uniref:Uncharacterized protein n=1 Tax=Mesobacillus subterraneus TaxID=285983 RepID=A0A0D6ZB39_9BACI|nr:hypothetical protein UB32_07775 [Mesobacillus subterraneus]
MARYYNSDTGRFISRDTFHGFEDDHVSWAVADNFIKVGKISKYLKLVNGSVIKKASKAEYKSS